MRAQSPLRLDIAWTPQRVVAVACILLAGVACGIVVVGASGSSRSRAADRLEPALASAWPAIEDLSTAIDANAPRAQAQTAARNAAAAVAAARQRVERLDLPVSATPVLISAQLALESAAAWIDAVGSVLANPRSQRRGDLAEAASEAAAGVARAGNAIPAARGTVFGTGHLLSATR